MTTKQIILDLRNQALFQRQKRGYTDHLLLLEIIGRVFPGQIYLEMFKHISIVMHDFHKGVTPEKVVDSQLKTTIEMFCVMGRN